MITAFVGPFGSGKTLLMTAKGYAKFRRGHRVFANYGVKFKHEKLNAKRLVKMGEELQDCVILADEFHIILDSRDGMKDQNKMLTYFILQTRKRGVSLFFTTQHESQVDVRLRRNVDYWVFCRRIARGVFLYRVENYAGRLVKKFVLRGDKYYSLYDTRETITDFVGAKDER